MRIWLGREIVVAGLPPLSQVPIEASKNIFFFCLIKFDAAQGARKSDLTHVAD